jgi:chemotaxis protein CheD
MAEAAQKVNMGELKIAGKEATLAAYGIGSCVIVVCYDSAVPVAGMLHAMLPEKHKKDPRENKFADAGVENLVKGLIEHKASISRLRAKLFGGAKMFDVKSGFEAIGDRNVQAAREALAKKGIPVDGEDTGSNYGRSIEFNVATCVATVKSFMHGSRVV